MKKNYAYPKIKPYQLLAGYNDKEFAKKIGMSVTSLSQKRNGIRDFKVQEAITICKLTGQKFDDIFLP